MLSVVTSLYGSAPYVGEFARRTFAAARRANEPVEIVLVVDGCTSGSLDAALEIAAADTRVTVLDLAYNAGQHRALFAGLAVARGDRVLVTDCDLEIAPEVMLAAA